MDAPGVFFEKVVSVNVSTVVVLVVLAALLALAVRYLVCQQRAKRCAGCSSTSCGAEATGCCSTAEKALADVEARLGPVGGERPQDR